MRDFGGLVTRVPRTVLAPASVNELATIVTKLASSNTSFVVRGAAHTAGGQTVTDGVLVVTRGLRGIVADRPECDELVVEAGALWLDVVRHLSPQGRRPTALTDNLRTTIGGTLALGGFGDTSHWHGLQIASVAALTVITPGGQRVSCGADDDLFRYSLAGLGQLGIIAEVTLRTLCRPPLLTARVLTWRSLDTFLGDTHLLRRYEYLRARLQFEPEGAAQVVALAGDFGLTTGAASATPATRIHRYAVDAGTPSPRRHRRHCLATLLDRSDQLASLGVRDLSEADAQYADGLVDGGPRPPSYVRHLRAVNPGANRTFR